MKKSLAYSTLVISTLLISSGAVLAVNETNFTTTTGSNPSTTVAEEQLPNTTNQLPSKNENVYIITDATGKASKSFVNSQLNTSQTPLPIKMKIAYSLDGQEIAPTELAGKSGHVKITYHFTPIATYYDKCVPFLVATGLQLNQDKFTNIKLSNGKIISENNDYTIIGYSFIGLNQNLGTDLLPEDFILEADTTNFELDNTYSFATNEVIAELDTSKLSSADEIINSINQLSNGLDQLISGSKQLDSGLASLTTGITKLQTGANALSTGANQLATGATTINNGTHELATGSQKLSNGLNQLVDIDNQVLSYLNPITAKIDSQIPTLLAKISTLTETEPELAAELSQALTELLNYYEQTKKAVTDYTDGVNSLANGANELTTGLNQLSDGTNSLASGANDLASGTSELKNGIDQLASGANQLSSGSKTLTSGLSTFKISGIDKLTNFANHDLNSFIANARSTIIAARSYHSYQSPSAKSVKFIFKTPSIK